MIQVYFKSEEKVKEIQKIRDRSIVNFGWSMIKDLPLHKYSGEIRYHIPNTRIQTNYLPSYRKKS